MKRFFIIGNGFDLHHKLNTGFNNFKDYLKKHFPEQLKFINNLIFEYNSSFDSNDWNQIEDELVCITKIDYDYMLDEAIDCSETDMGRASYWNDIQYNAEYFNDDLPDFKKCFDEWIDSIDIKSAKCDKCIRFNLTDQFLNFNYTDTLQFLYMIEDSQVLHIHGKKLTEKVFGHNEYFEEPLQMTNLTQADYDHGIEGDWRIEEAKGILNRIPTLFYKDSINVIKNHQIFFKGIDQYDKLIFMGWALGEQDEIYMSEILSNIKPNSKIVVVYYEGDATIKQTYQEFFKSYHIEDKNILYYPWNELEKVFMP